MDNTFITQCFKAQSILLGHRTNTTGTKALTTRDSHNCHLRPTSNVSLKSSKKGIGEKENSSWQLDTGLIPCEGLGVARRWPPVLLQNINNFAEHPHQTRPPVTMMAQVRDRSCQPRVNLAACRLLKGTVHSTRVLTLKRFVKFGSSIRCIFFPLIYKLLV